jgi:hypothetical protein
VHSSQPGSVSGMGCTGLKDGWAFSPVQCQQCKSSKGYSSCGAYVPMYRTRTTVQLYPWLYQVYFSTVVLGCNALSHSEGAPFSHSGRQPSATATGADDHQLGRGDADLIVP